VTVNAREEILTRVRTALRDRPEPPDVRRDYRGPAEPDHRTVAERLDLLAERLADYRAAVRRCAADDIPATVAAALRDRGARRVVVPAGIPAGWLDSTDEVELVPDAALDHAELDALDGVVTACAIAVAETGTIVLDAGPGQGRRAVTLVPDYHLVVVRADQVVSGVPAAVAKLVPTRPLTWISGPSATSDIELDRVEGVHGPRNLEVILAG
jgi:L-lactate dehydrogenase complex protein LldG